MPINTPGTPNSPITPNSLNPITSLSTALSSTGGGAPKSYRLLSDLYKNLEEIQIPTEELMMIRNDEEPTLYVEDSKKKEWIKAMNAELASIEKNNTWILVNLPKNRKAIILKWLYKLKRDPTRKIIKHMEIIVAKGYIQKHRIDYDEVFTQVARIETVHFILALAGTNGWWVHNLDVKSVFLDGELKEEVHVSQAEGETNKVYKLTKALYGLKQEPKGLE